MLQCFDLQVHCIILIIHTVIKTAPTQCVMARASCYIEREVRSADEEGGWLGTCPEAELIKVPAAAIVGLTQIVTATVWWLHLNQLKTPVPAGAGGGHVLRRRPS